jgi:hypothetical protein
MSVGPSRVIPIAVPPVRPAGWLQGFGDALQRHRGAVSVVQWTIVLVYAALVVVPVLLPPPPADAKIWTNLTLAAQFAFWGIWWPFVILSVVLGGRMWCGLLCPEGTLTEFASRHGLGRTIPRWLRWSGWTTLAFIATTLWGQLVSVYDYPKATLLILGGSTVVATAVGFVFGRGKRVWCRYLCPVSGIFGLLARLAPLHYRADEEAWKRHDGPRERVNCAPLLDLRHLQTAADCHACGRCSGHRGAIALRARIPGSELAAAAPHRPTLTAARLLLFGVFGVAIGAFQWSASPLYIAARQAAATWLVDHDILWPLQDNAPWWLLTHEPQAHDVFLWLDGMGIVAYLAATTLVIGGGAWLALRAAACVLRNDIAWARLALTLAPLGAAVLFVGLSQMTLTQLRAEGLQPPGMQALRALLLASASLWSLWLAHRVTEQSQQALWRRVLTWALIALPIALVDFAWWRHFHGS